MQSLWEELRNGWHQKAVDQAEGAILAFVAAGLFNEAEADGWRARIQRCPGHECCRVWCAYCGEIEMDENDPRRDP
jgi:hypothetical protein